jgi:CAAX prenyl protease-like protein
MTSPEKDILPRTPGAYVSDDLAYILPMGAFLVCVWAGGNWPDYYVHTYIARVILAGAMLIAFRKQYTRIKWNHWWLGVLVGIVGVGQWIGMQLFLQAHFEFFRPKPDGAFNPFEYFHSDLARNAFIGFRWILGAAIVVPIMEELFWRDFVWRSILAPNDFKLASVGEWDWKAFLIVSGVFAVVHGNWWLTAIVWALLVGGLLAYTKSLGACIIAHATTNFLLGAWVLYRGEWSFW